MVTLSWLQRSNHVCSFSRVSTTGDRLAATILLDALRAALETSAYRKQAHSAAFQPAKTAQCAQTPRGRSNGLSPRPVSPNTRGEVKEEALHDDKHEPYLNNDLDNLRLG